MHLRIERRSLPRYAINGACYAQCLAEIRECRREMRRAAAARLSTTARSDKSRDKRFASSALLERLKVIHMDALAALAEAVGTDHLHRIIGPAIGADLVRAGMLSRYEEIGPTDEDGESFIVYELTAVGEAAGLAWGNARRHGRSNARGEGPPP